MKRRRILYLISVIAIAVPWLFLLELLPVPYSQINSVLEVIIESAMFAALLAVVILLEKELKRLKAARGEADHEGNVQTSKGHNSARVIGRLLFILASITLFIVGLILLLVAISFTL